MRVKLNSFYYKSLKFPGATSSIWSPENVRSMIEENLDMKKDGDKPGTWLVPLKPHGFFSPTIPLKAIESDILGRFTARREGEDRFLQNYMPNVGRGAPAESVEAVIYHVPLLKADHEREGGDARDFYEDGDHHFEVVIVKAPAGEPMDPTTMVRNQLNLTGGTPCVYTSDDWCEAVHFWLTHVKGEA